MKQWLQSCSQLTLTPAIAAAMSAAAAIAVLIVAMAAILAAAILAAAIISHQQPLAANSKQQQHQQWPAAAAAVAGNCQEQSAGVVPKCSTPQRQRSTSKIQHVLLASKMHSQMLASLIS